MENQGATVQQVEGFPRGRNVVSRDPRKAHIVAAFKKALLCDKVTELHEPSPGVFVASCLEYNRASRGYRRMGTFQLVGLALAALLVCLAGAAEAQTFMAVSGDVSYQETAAGVATTLSAPAGGGTAAPNLLALTTASSGAVYGIDLGDWPTLAMHLVGFDAAGAVATDAQISYQGQPVLLAEGLAFAPNGKLWIAFGWSEDWDFYQSAHLGTIDPTTGLIDPASVVKLTGYGNIDADALEFIGGTLYMNDNVFGAGSTLYTVSLSTGAAITVGAIKTAAGVAFQVADLAWDGSQLWGEDVTGHLVKIDRHNGVASSVGAQHPAMNGLTVTATCHGRGCR